MSDAGRETESACWSMFSWAQQLVEIFTLSPEDEVAEIRIFTRPWLVTAHFRKRMHALLKDTLGPEFWAGPDPQGPLPTQ